MQPRTIEQCIQRLEHIRSLAKGWADNGAGEAVGADTIERARMLCNALAWSEQPLPYIYPTIDGGLSLEWTDTLPDVIIS